MRHSPLALAVVLTPLLAVPARAAGPYDGTWRGPQVTTLKNNTATCEKMDHDVTLRITDSRFSRRWGTSNDVLEVEVKPDGTFAATVASTGEINRARRHTREYTITGRIKDGVLEAEIGSSLCAVRWTLRRRG